MGQNLFLSSALFFVYLFFCKKKLPVTKFSNFQDSLFFIFYLASLIDFTV